MTIHVALQHHMRYRYDRRVRLGPQIVRLRPAPHCRTRILTYSLRVAPEPHFVNWQQDPFSNWQARYVFPDLADHLDVTVDLVAELAVLNPFDFFVEDSARTFPFAYDSDLAQDLEPYLRTTAEGERFAAYLAGIDAAAPNTVDFLVALNRRLQNDIAYLVRLEPGVHAPEETLARGRGSCRDSAWLLAQLLRRLGVASRFVSGYLIQLKPDQPPLEGSVGVDADFTDLHAWVEVFLPGAGWIGLDPTSGLLAGEGHLPLAATPDPFHAAPITGSVEPCEVAFDHEMSIERVFETPRVTVPYDPPEWAAIDASAAAVEERLRADDVRLAAGGRPTFSSVDDRDGAEWNSAALGPTKHALALALVDRLQARLAPTGLLIHGQGAWFPGEPLPRWALTLHWRADGEPLWSAPRPSAEERPRPPADVDAAGRFAHALARRLGLDPECVRSAHEDPAVFPGAGALRPQGADRHTATGQGDLETPQRPAPPFDDDAAPAVAAVLPLQARELAVAGRRRLCWTSDRWETRRGHLVLVAGDSPAGFRLPLSSVVGLDATDAADAVVPLDPFADRPALPTHAMAGRERAAPAEPSAAARRSPVRTALVVEPRDGRLAVFLPPTESADAFVELVAAIERTAVESDQTVRLEGYPAPPDPRLRVIEVTPDRGVIAVDLPPARSWREQVALSRTVYAEARLARLDTAKFLLDGRPTGTGGGHRIVLGGPAAADSPFLRRADLLASVLRYWQNHPALSFLFSRLAIGPSGPAPRLDEGQRDRLYELEIALAQVPGPAGFDDTPPWLADRLFRDLLVAPDGDARGGEICIDRLYHPGDSLRRRGLVAFRAFEMPPHPEMSLVQHLLLRALVAWFWREPYTRPLERFDAALHDRFMLPEVVWADLEAVLAELAAAGFHLAPTWFRPHFEFRFPRYGEVEAAGLRIELRAALEPWQPLALTGAGDSAGRAVDDSLERLEVKVEGAENSRLVVACNGWRLPLQDIGRGQAVAGVRFRAWRPPSCLHPTIGVHGPLVFDVVDTAAARAVGGCTYHVTHPGGRNYTTLPVNALEAHARRHARFQASGHTPGPIRPRTAPPHPEAPWTLDLRRTTSGRSRT